MERERNNKSKRNSPVWLIVLVAFLVVIFIGGGIWIYYHYFESTSKEETDEDLTPPVVVTDWREEGQKIVREYLKYTIGEAPSFKSSFTRGEDYIIAPGAQEFRTESLNNYLLCVRNWQTAHPEKLVLHADVINGIQDITDYEIISVTQTEEDDITVVVKFAFLTPKNVKYYLVKQGEDWLIDSTNEIEKMVKDVYVRETTGCKKE